MSGELLSELDELVSEGRNPRTNGIDRMSSLELLVSINNEDARVAAAVAEVLPETAEAVDRIVAGFGNGGRLIYMGAGTSGRLGVLDASECPPTFSVPEGMVVGLIAGGESALRHASEGAEDDEGAGANDLVAISLNSSDVVVGLAVSGRTPYVLGGLRKANEIGATSVAITCNPGSPATQIAEISISPNVGPEVLTGSTRLKSGTAQKLVLNMLSTASMIRIGKVYTNLMVDLDASNAKLKARAIRVVMQAAECSADEARQALARADHQVKPAILSLILNIDIETARVRLARANGIIGVALEIAGASRDSLQTSNGEENK